MASYTIRFPPLYLQKPGSPLRSLETSLPLANLDSLPFLRHRHPCLTRSSQSLLQFLLQLIHLDTRMLLLPKPPLPIQTLSSPISLGPSNRTQHPLAFDLYFEPSPIFTRQELLARHRDRQYWFRRTLRFGRMKPLGQLRDLSGRIRGESGSREGERSESCEVVVVNSIEEESRGMKGFDGFECFGRRSFRGSRFEGRSRRDRRERFRSG